jgi:hypothetical protein
MSDRQLLKCRIRRGMFPDEFLVSVNSVNAGGDPLEVFAFADREELQTDRFPENSQEEVSGFLRVYTLSSRDQFSSVVLPKPSLANGTTIKIASADLKMDCVPHR